MQPDPVAELPPLREAIREAGLSARKGLGQNFLLDLNITRRIARAAGPLEGVGIVEVGPGPGGLTRALLLEGARHVTAIERDERFRPVLDVLAAAGGGRLSVVFADATTVAYDALAQSSGATRVVANLPYNIATPLIVGWLSGPRWPPWFDRVTVMVQKEVADRLVAPPASEAYGRLGVLAQWRAAARILFTLPPSVFTPSPRVSSALVELVPRASPEAELPPHVLEKVTAAAFGQRRKMLRSSLAALGVDTPELLRRSGIEPSNRAEQLGVEDFVRLSRCLLELDPTLNAGRRRGRG